MIRTIAHMTDEETAWRLTGKSGLGDDISLFDEEIGDHILSYDDIRNNGFVSCLESMYLYAYFGADRIVNSMEYGSDYTLMATIVHDMAKSQETLYWDKNCGFNDRESAVKCYHFIEVANARCILENNRNFLYYDDDSKEEYRATPDAPSYNFDRFALSVPQMALLAGMGEMSIRAAANPKRTNALKTYSDGGRTRIAIKDAKEWLQLKGRYVPITRQFEDSTISLTKRQFVNFDDLNSFIKDRCLFLAAQSERTVEYGFPYFDREALLDTNFVRDLAKTIRFPVDLFSLRVRELLAKEDLNEIARELRNIAPLTH